MDKGSSIKSNHNVIYAFVCEENTDSIKCKIDGMCATYNFRMEGGDGGGWCMSNICCVRVDAIQTVTQCK